MKKQVCNVFILMLINVAAHAQYSWTEENHKASWPSRDSQGEFVFNNQMWIMGGWDTPETPNFLDVWKSGDGKNWERVVEKAPWIQSDLPVSLVFNNRMWIMGGRTVPGTVCSNKVWSSTDGITWELVTDNAGWSPRLSPGFAVFKNKMWVLGGTSSFYMNNDSTLMNDVWSSSDGKTWKLETAHAPWSKRAHAQAVVFNNKMWIMGGGSRAPQAIPTNDVWCSDDGVNWKRATASAEWGPRLWFSCAVYRGHMWVLGGWSKETGNYGDVWYSKNGKHWTEFKSDHQWQKRHEHSAFVFSDKLWIAGGASEPNYQLNSEVWSLYLPANWKGKN